MFYLQSENKIIDIDNQSGLYSTTTFSSHYQDIVLIHVYESAIHKGCYPHEDAHIKLKSLTRPASHQSFSSAFQKHFLFTPCGYKLYAQFQFQQTAFNDFLSFTKCCSGRTFKKKERSKCNEKRLALYTNAAIPMKTSTSVVNHPCRFLLVFHWLSKHGFLRLLTPSIMCLNRLYSPIY